MMMGLGLDLAAIAGMPRGLVAWPRGAAAAYGVSFGTGDHVGIQRTVNGFDVWSHLGGSWYERLLHYNLGVNRASNIRRELVRVFDLWTADEFVTSGTVSFLNASAMGAELAYIGRVAASLNATGTSVTVDVTGAGDLYVAYMGRTVGGYARVDIDGAQTLVALPVLPGVAYKGIDTYSATDLVRGSTVKVASGLPQGTYTVTVTRTADRNPASTGNGVYVEAAMIESTVAGPRIQPRPWTSGETVKMGVERQNAGIVYSARNNGTTGTTPPTHTSGQVSDGAVDWLVAPGGTTYFWNRQDLTFASEREYAYNVTVNGVTEDVGGQGHGNDEGSAFALSLDGVAIDPATASYEVIASGDEITVGETITWTHPQAATLATGSLARTFRPGEVQVSGSVTMQVAADLGYAYGAMLPFVRQSAGGEPVFDEVRAADGTVVDLDAYDGTSAEIDFGNQYSFAIAGDDVLGRPIVTAVRSNRDAVKGYASGRLFVQANRTAAALGAASEWQAKGYFELAPDANRHAAAVGEEITFWQESVTALG